MLTCIRWDYLEPFAKVFLLCGEIAYTWNPGEKTGRRYQTAEQDQATLELIRLSTERLEQDYTATLATSSREAIVIELIPKIENGRITSAKLVTNFALDRLIELSFSDTDGNLTNFEMTNHRALEGTDKFTAPTQLTWLEN